MAKNIKYLFRAIAKNIKNAMALKTDFFITVIGMAINDIAFLVIWLSFVHTVGVVNGWTGIDMLGLYGFSLVSFGIVQSAFGGIVNLPTLITNGSLDRFMYTPKNKVIKVATSKFDISALGDLLCGIVCLIIFLLNIKLTVFVIPSVLLMLIIAIVIHFAFMFFASTVAFYFMDGKDISRIGADIFVLPTTFNAGLIKGVLRIIYIYFIPALLTGGLAIEFIKNMTIDKLLLMLTVTLVWFAFSIIFFNLSLRRYESSNFITFGQND